MRARRVDKISAVGRTLLSHPATRAQLGLPIVRFARWQISKRRHGVGVQQLPAGGRVRAYADSTALSDALYFGFVDWHEMQLVARVLRAGDTFVDIGANVGTYSAMVASRVGTGGRVIAAEPLPRNAERLRDTFLLNGLDPRDCHATALGAQEGQVTLVGEDATAHVDDSGSGIEVRMTTFDDLVAGAEPDVAKVDVEGFELQVLQGAVGALTVRRPRLWVIETNDLSDLHGQTREALHRFVRAHDADMYRVERRGGRLRRIPVGGPYPQNCAIVVDPSWLHERTNVRLIES